MCVGVVGYPLSQSLIQAQMQLFALLLLKLPTGNAKVAPLSTHYRAKR